MNTSDTMVAFDFDGTIVDTEVAEYEVWLAVATEFGSAGVAPRIRNAIIYGPQHDSDELAEEIAIKAGVPQFIVTDEYRKRLYEHPMLDRVRTDAVDLLRGCIRAGHRRIVCSGASHSWIGWLLRRFNLYNDFERRVTRETWKKNHNKTDVYRMLREYYLTEGVSNFFAVEDSPRGVHSAYEGGWVPVYLPNGLIDGSLAELQVPNEIVLQGLDFFQSKTLDAKKGLIT